MKKLALLLAAILTVELMVPSTSYAASLDTVNEVVMESAETMEATTEVQEPVVEADETVAAEAAEEEAQIEAVTEETATEVVEDATETEELLEEETEAVEETEELLEEETEVALEEVEETEGSDVIFYSYKKAHEYINGTYRIVFGAGFPVTVMETQPTGIEKVTYTLDGGSEEFTADFVGNNGYAFTKYSFWTWLDDYKQTAGYYVMGQIHVSKGITVGEHTIKLKFHSGDHVLSTADVPMTFAARTYPQIIPTTDINKINVPVSSGDMWLSYIGDSMVNSTTTVVTNKISLYKDDAVVWSKDLNHSEKVRSDSYDTRNQNEEGVIELTEFKSYAASAMTLIPPMCYGVNSNIGIINISDEIAAGTLKAGETYDLLVERNDGSSTLFKEKVYLSTDTVISQVGIATPGHGTFSMPLRGDYITVFVYGINLNKDIVPVFYDGSTPMTDSTIAGYEAFPMAENGGVYAKEGAFFKLKKLDGYKSNTFDGPYGSLKVKFQNAFVTSYNSDEKKNELVTDREMNLYNQAGYYDILQIERVTIGGNYVRFFVDADYFKEGDSIEAKYWDAKDYVSATIKKDSYGRLYADFEADTNVYKTTDPSYDVRYNGRTKEYDGMLFNRKMMYANNLNVPDGCTWEIQSTFDVGAPIYSGTNSGASVLTAEQVSELRKIGTVRANIYKNGKIISQDLLHFIAEGNNVEVVRVTNDPGDYFISLDKLRVDSNLSLTIEKNKEFIFYAYAYTPLEIVDVTYTVDGKEMGSVKNLGLEDKYDFMYKYSIPASSVTGDINLHFTVASGSYKVTSAAGNYTIGTSQNPTGTTLDAKGTAESDFTFFVKPKSGYLIDKVTYKVGSTAEVVITPDAEDLTKYVIPAGKISASTVVKVNTFQVADFSTATVTATFPSEISPGVVKYTGSDIEAKTITVTVDGVTVSPSEYTVTYSEDHKNAGTACLTVTAVPQSKKYSGSKDYFYTIQGINLTDDKEVTMTLKNATIPWNGKEIKAALELKAANGTILKENQDYMLVYSNNVKTGKASVAVIGIGGYEGFKEFTYMITKPSFKTDVYSDLDETVKTQEQAKADGKIFVSLATKKYTYSGQAFTPEVIVRYLDENGEMADLKAGTDYTVKYTNNIASSEGQINVKKLPTVTITGKGTYQGSKTLNFKISPLSMNGNDDIVITAPSVQAKEGVAATTKPIVMLSKNGIVKVLKAGTDYEKLTEADFTNNTGASKLGTVTIKGKGNFTGSKSAQFAIATKNLVKLTTIGLSLDGAALTAPVTYRGTAITPIADVLLKEDGTALKLGTDYTVQYLSNINAGNGIVRVVGIGDYYGYKDVKFKIAGRKISEKAGETDNLDKLQITLNGKSQTTVSGVNGYDLGYEFTGYAYTPVVNMVDTGAAGTVLRAGVDYTVKYANNINASVGTKLATATITFKGNYTGKVVKNFNIASWAIDDFPKTLITVDDAPYNNGKVVTTKITVTRNELPVNPKALKIVYDKGNVKTTIGADAGKELAVAISGAKGASDTNITLGHQPATGIMKNFKLVKADLKDVVFGKIPAQTFSGKAVELSKLSVTYNKAALKPNVDYTISYIDNAKRGVAKVIITAKEGSNFTGSASADFIIK